MEDHDTTPLNRDDPGAQTAANDDDAAMELINSLRRLANPLVSAAQTNAQRVESDHPFDAHQSQSPD